MTFNAEIPMSPQGKSDYEAYGSRNLLSYVIAIADFADVWLSVLTLFGQIFSAATDNIKWKTEVIFGFIMAENQLTEL